MDKLLTWLAGKKTYLVALAAAGLAFCSSLGIVVPEWVIQLLAALGLATLRSAVK